MTSKQQMYALVGAVFGAVCGWFFFKGSDGNVFFTILPAALLAIAFAFIGYYLARDTTRLKQ